MKCPGQGNTPYKQLHRRRHGKPRFLFAIVNHIPAALGIVPVSLVHWGMVLAHLVALTDLRRRVTGAAISIPCGFGHQASATRGNLPTFRSNCFSSYQSIS
jgi:hypothetical protein